MKKGLSSKRYKLYTVLNLAFAALLIAIFLIFFIEGYNKSSDYSFTQDEIFDWGSDWSVITAAGTKEKVSLPAAIEVKYGETVTLSKTLPDTIKKYNCLMYECKHQDVSVTVGGVSRYVYSDSDTSTFGNSMPNAIIMVPLYSSDEGYEISVDITSVSHKPVNIGTFYLSNERSILLMLIKKNVMWFILSTALFVMAAVNMVCCFMYRRNMSEGMAFGYLAGVALLAGIWSIFNLQIRQIFIRNLRLGDNLGNLCMMLMPAFIIGVSYWMSGDRYKKIYRAGMVITLVNFTLQSVIYVLGIYDFFEMRNITDLLLLIGLAVIIAIFIKESRKNNDIRHPLGGLIALFAAETVTIIGALINKTEYSSRVFIISFIIYVLINSLNLIFRVVRKERVRKDAISANEAKSRFLATMSHEIRTPINAVLGMNEMIARESNEVQIKEYSATISDAGKSLLALVNDILDFSKIEAGKMEIVPVEYSLRSVLNELFTITAEHIKDKELKLVLNVDETIPAKLYGDEKRVRQILVNLMVNAAKYTENGSITFTAEKRNTDGNKVEIYFSVKDTGMGIRKEDLSLLMQSSFVRVDEVRNSNIEGSGLGLSITRQLLELMGSELKIESEYGAGSDFHFLLTQTVIDSAPMGPVDINSKKQPEAFKAGFTIPQARILAVDDNKVNLMVFKKLLTIYDCQITTCTSGRDCIELCRYESFDLIFMDHMMPEMDGIETLKILRENEGIIDKSVKVIALTANAISGAEQLYKDSGFDGYLTKPIDFAELEKIIEENIPADMIEYKT